MKIFSTFISGTEKIVERAIKKRPIEKIKILSLMDGLIVYETKYSLKDIREIRFFNNSFVLIDSFKNLGDDPITKMMYRVLATFHLPKNIIAKLHKIKSFKIVTSLENQTIAANRELLKKLETKIIAATYLKLNVKNPDLEFWFLGRSENIGLFGFRITGGAKRKNLQRGELRPELADLLCLVSEPKPNDIFLDPFGGFGAIPNERILGFPYKKIIVVEKDFKKYRALLSRLKNHPNISVINADTLNVSEISDASVEKIVTDPPWGLFEEIEMPLQEFYKKMLLEFCRVLKNDGIAVILTGSPEKFEEALETLQHCFNILEKFSILVSGKKAVIFKLVKK